MAHCRYSTPWFTTWLLKAKKIVCLEQRNDHMYTVIMVFINGNEIASFMWTEWRERFSTMDTAQVFDWRRCNIRRLDGNIMPPIATWPTYVRRIFFQTAYPLGNRQVLKLYLFFVGNGVNPLLTVKWIISSFALSTWTIRREPMLRRRINQIKWITDNLPMNQHNWAYYDLDERRIVHFDGRRYVQ